MKIRIYKGHEYGTFQVLGVRNIGIIPNLTLSFYNNWKFEAFKLSWVGFTFAIWVDRSEVKSSKDSK